MKKLTLLIPLLIFPTLTGCGNIIKTQLTYGTLISTTATQLTPSEFDTRYDAGENFLLAIYPKDSSCLCWGHFEYVINQAVEKDNLLIYKYYAQEVSSSVAMKENGNFRSDLSHPTFYVVRNKNIAKYYPYNSDNPFYTEYTSFKKEMEKVCKFPKIYYVNEDILDQKLLDTKCMAFYIRESCSDCKYLIPNALIPYIDSHNFNDKIYMIDFDPYRSSDPTLYQEKKDKYKLSTKYNEHLGYDTGYIPTLQFYENGILKDMMVYFNDKELIYDETKDVYHVSDSYYNEERNIYHHYLDNITDKDLTKVDIKAEDTIQNRSWKSSSAAVYHNQILNAFLDKYLA